MAAEDDARLWAVASAGVPIWDRISGDFMLQTRVSDDIGELERVVLRPWLSARLADGFSASLGYDAHFIEEPSDSVEHRIWEQLSLSHALGSLGLSHRARLEQRFIEDIDGVALRLRYLLRLSHDLGTPKWYASVANEVFLDLNSPDTLPDSGFGEDRASAVIGHRAGAHLRLEAGYQLQYVDRNGQDAANHTLLLGVRFAP